MTSLLRLGRSPRPQRMSATLRRLAHQIEDQIRLSELVVHLGDRTFGAILLVFAIPNLIPLPPGSSTVLGIPLILAAAQLAMGRSSLWLPQVVGNRTLLRSDLERLVYHGVPALRRLERLLVPRLGPLLNERLIGAACLLLAVILILPIPFGNMLPALGIAAFSLRLLQRDGLAVLVGWAVTLASLLFVALVSSALLLMARTAVEAGRALLGV
jgi:hypothetical protein